MSNYPSATEEAAFLELDPEDLQIVQSRTSAQVTITHKPTMMVSMCITHPVTSMNHDSAMSNLRAQVAAARRANWYAENRE